MMYPFKARVPWRMVVVPNNVRSLPGILMLGVALWAASLAMAGPMRRWSVLRVDSVEVRFGPKDAKNAQLVVRHLTLDGLPISDELGLHRLPQAVVILAPDREAFDSLSAPDLPRWTAAVAMPESRRIVLKSPRWERNANLVTDLLHELTHIMVAEAAGKRPVPRWFNEGLALYYSRDLQYARSRALARALITRSLVDLDDVDKVLRFNRAKAELAYQESLEAVRYMFERFGDGVAQDILEQVASGASFRTAFYRATGVAYPVFKLELLQYWRKRHRWDFLADLTYVVWGAAVAAAVAAYFLMRRRNRRRLEQWATEEGTIYADGYWRSTTISSDPIAHADSETEAH